MVGEELKSLLVDNGWQPVLEKDAEIIFVNSCSFLKTKEQEFLKLIKEISQSVRPNQKLVVFGCLPATSKNKILKISPRIMLFGRDLQTVSKFFHLKNISQLVNFTDNEKLTLREKNILWLNRYFIRDDGIKYRLKKDQIYHLKISDGCLGRCSYCSEKFTSKFQSQKIEKIIESFEKGLEMGYKLFALNSDDTSAFGADNGENIVQLLQKMLSYSGDFRIAITEFNPRGLFFPGIEKVLSNKKIIYITIPIQSGSDRVLALMNRPYKILPVLKKIKRIKLLNKKLKINTHIIVGFPTESDFDFLQTLNLIKNNYFDRVKIFAYSDRPNTKASKMTGKIDQNIIAWRQKKLIQTILLTNIKRFSLSNFLLNSKTLS